MLFKCFGFEYYLFWKMSRYAHWVDMLFKCFDFDYYPFLKTSRYAYCLDMLLKCFDLKYHLSWKRPGILFLNMLASNWIFNIIFIEISKLQPWWRSDNVGAPQQGLHGGGQEDHERGSKPPQLFCLSISKHCQRHNGPEGWVHITRSQFTNLEHIAISESWLSINFKISTKHQYLD